MGEGIVNRLLQLGGDNSIISLTLYMHIAKATNDNVVYLYD